MARGIAKAILSIEGSDGFVTSTAAPIASGWSDRYLRKVISDENPGNRVQGQAQPARWHMWLLRVCVRVR